MPGRIRPRRRGNEKQKMDRVDRLRGAPADVSFPARVRGSYDDRITTYRLSPDVIYLFNFYEVTGEAGE